MKHTLRGVRHADETKNGAVNGTIVRNTKFIVHAYARGTIYPSPLSDPKLKYRPID